MFHSLAWLGALNRTYGYRIVAYTTSGPGEMLHNAIVCCQIQSWVTGRRLVSLPFSDHCEPLVENEDDLKLLLNELQQDALRERCRYIEIRPLTAIPVSCLQPSVTARCSLHQLDLQPELDGIFRNFHQSSIRRKILRSQRERLEYEEGSADWHLDAFYHLFVATRRRHGLPPPPRDWFENLASCFGPALKIRIALKGRRPVASILTVCFNNTLAYKYGCSESRYHNLGGVHLLLWTSIQEAKAAGLRLFDLGRTDAGQAGLITFKNRWGAKESILTYSRFAAEGPPTHMMDFPASRWKSAARRLLAHMPPPVLSLMGRMLYRHIG